MSHRRHMLYDLNKLVTEHRYASSIVSSTLNWLSQSISPRFQQTHNLGYQCYLAPTIARNKVW